MLGTTMPIPLTYSMADTMPLLVTNGLANTGIGDIEAVLVQLGLVIHSAVQSAGLVRPIWKVVGALQALTSPLASQTRTCHVTVERDASATPAYRAYWAGDCTWPLSHRSGPAVRSAALAAAWIS